MAEKIDKKFEEAHPSYFKQARFWIALLVIVAMLGFVFYTFYARTQGAKNAGPQLETATITVGNGILIVDVAQTVAEQQHGLSDRPSMAQDHGMIFPISPPGRPGFWMKDMSFPLDMIYINKGRVVEIKNNMQPLLVPIPFYPDAETDTVLEVNAGWAAKNYLSVGDSVQGL